MVYPRSTLCSTVNHFGVSMDARRYLPALDGIRGLAILAVMSFHLVDEIAPGGAVGVDLFFALSGFLITGLLLDELARNQSVDLVSFYWRRTCRLLPALMVFLILVAPPVAYIIGQDGVLLSSAKTLGYVSDFARSGVWLGPLNPPYGHTWSLAVEEQFYLVWPCALWLLVRSQLSLVRVSAVLLVAALATSWICGALLGGGTSYFLPTGHLWSLAAGLFAAVVVRTSGGHRVVAVAGRDSVGALAWLVLAFAVFAPIPTWPTVAEDGMQLVVMIALIVCHLNAVADRGGLVGRLLSSRVLGWIGMRSYGIYLYHGALYYAFGRSYDNLPRSANIVLVIVLSLVLADLSYRYVESPLRRRGRAWDARRKVQLAARAQSAD